jgi:rhomboid protease GluP
VNLTIVLVAINVVAYLWLVSTGGLSSNAALLDHGALLGVACTEYGQWWRIVTGAFLHGSIAHIGLNMLALFQLGTAVNALYGTARYALLYAIALVGSGLAIVVFSPDYVTVGASGAIFGLFGALVAAGLRMGSRGRGLIGQVLPIIAINLVFTFAVPGISASGHVGGLVTGFAAGLVLYMLPSRRRRDGYAYVAAPAGEAPPADTIEHDAEVETIEQPPDAGPHEEAGAPPPHVRDPRE